ncbi:MAG: DUF4956 domain-containing protein [Rikenellaceae bacterium]
MNYELLESLTLFGIRLFDFDDFGELVLRFLLNSSVLYLVVRFCYLTHSTRRNYTFSFAAVGTTVFLLCSLLGSVKLELGFALGLFAIFGIIRYRTDAIPFKQMTYLFVVIGLSVMNALANKKVSYIELIFTNAVIVAGLWLLERSLCRTHERTVRVTYERIDNVNRGNYEALRLDLEQRTGFEVHHFEILRIDYLRDVAEIDVHLNRDDNCYTMESEMENETANETENKTENETEE